MDFGKPLRKGKYQKFSRRDFLLINCLVHSNLGFLQVNSYVTFLRDLLVQFTSCITALLGLEKDKIFSNRIPTPKSNLRVTATL